MDEQKIRVESEAGVVDEKPRRIRHTAIWIISMIPVALLLGGFLLWKVAIRQIDTETFFAASAPASAPIPPLAAYEDLGGVTVDIWFLSQPRYFDSQTVFAEQLQYGLTDTGETAFFVAYDEEGLNAYLNYWFTDTVLGWDERVRDPWVDLRPGGVVLYLDVNLEVEWVRVGLVFRLREDEPQLDYVGIDVDDTLYINRLGEISERASVIEDLANRALRDLDFIDAAGARYRISQITIGEDRAEILASIPGDAATLSGDCTARALTVAQPETAQAIQDQLATNGVSGAEVKAEADGTGNLCGDGSASLDQIAEMTVTVDMAVESLADMDRVGHLARLALEASDAAAGGNGYPVQVLLTFWTETQSALSLWTSLDAWRDPAIQALDGAALVEALSTGRAP